MMTTAQNNMQERPRRHIISKIFPFDVTNYAADKTRLAMRVLEPITKLPEEMQKVLVKKPAHNINLLHSTLQLASNKAQQNLQEVNFTFEIDGVRYFILLEEVFDKNTHLLRKSWLPMGNLAFVVRKDEGVLTVVDTQKESYISRFRTAYQAQFMGRTTLGQVFCRDKKDNVDECAMSFATKPNGKIITKLRIDKETTPAGFVNDKVGASRYLNILPRMTAPDHCKPNELVTIHVQFYQGNTDNKITGVNWDGLVVEAVDGYAPHKRVKIRDGKGSFKVRALDLEDGDIMRIKLNTKWYTDKAECQIKVLSNP